MNGIIIWSICTVVMTFLPLLLGAMTGQFSSLKNFMGNAELLLICVAFDSESLGEFILELLSQQIFVETGTLLIALLNLVVIVAASFIYIPVSRYSQEKGNLTLVIPPHWVVPPIFISAILLSFVTKIELLHLTAQL